MAQPRFQTRVVGGKTEIVLSAAQMREADAYTIATSVGGEELMRRAAQGVFDAVEGWRGRIAIVCGGGNNGGDGYALACILSSHGHAPAIYRVGTKLTQTAAPYLAQARGQGVPVFEFLEGTSLRGYDFVVDCILGTGFSGAVRGLAREAVKSVNASGAYVVSVDINSGLNGDTGQAELAVKSDLTVSIGFYKQGLLAPCARAYIGRLINVDIGILLAGEEPDSG